MTVLGEEVFVKAKDKSMTLNKLPLSCFFLLQNLDVDECENNICDANAVCNNTEGSYVCRCNEGYTGNGRICTGT